MSQVQGIDTDRGNILKDSGFTLQEDSTLLNDVDDPKIPMGLQHHEVLNDLHGFARQLEVRLHLRP